MEKPTEDHRTRVAAARRHRTQVKIQNAIVACYASTQGLQLPSVEPICEAADISRATFYKYFDSVSEASDLIGRSMLDEMFNSLVTLLGRDYAPLERIAIGTQLFLMRGATDGAWATFVTRAILTNQDTDFARGIEDDVRDLIVQSDTLSADSEAAKSLILGTVLEGIRYVHQNRERQRQFVEHLTAMMLCGLGATHQEATDLVHRTSIHIRGLALDNVEWWKDPWT